eukprot:scaffold145893_cov34-Tisochrysis_lutea.AAC.2
MEMRSISITDLDTDRDELAQSFIAQGDKRSITQYMEKRSITITQVHRGLHHFALRIPDGRSGPDI